MARICVGSMSEGIYRRSGANSSVTRLLTQFRKDAWAVQLARQEYNEYDVASVLKRFLRDLPEPLLTTELHSQLCEIAGTLSCLLARGNLCASHLGGVWIWIPTRDWLSWGTHCMNFHSWRKHKWNQRGRFSLNGGYSELCRATAHFLVRLAECSCDVISLRKWLAKPFFTSRNFLCSDYQELFPEGWSSLPIFI
jgi:hypothetical protein